MPRLRPSTEGQLAGQGVGQARLLWGLNALRDRYRLGPFHAWVSPFSDGFPTAGCHLPRLMRRDGCRRASFSRMGDTILGWLSVRWYNQGDWFEGPFISKVDAVRLFA